MQQQVVFDQYGSISDARKVFLETLLASMTTPHRLQTALDVGCGVGFFARYLADRGLTVTGLDARAENIAEARRRYPDIRFEVADVEDVTLPQLGLWDLTLCFGLLYHLENPFRAVRNLFAVTGRLLIIESTIVPGSRPLAALVDEPHSPDQGMRYVALVPSAACLTRMLYRSGFPLVYSPRRLPDHPDFQDSRQARQRRSVLIASTVQLSSSFLEHQPDPPNWDPWQKPWVRTIQRAIRFIRKPTRDKAHAVLSRFRRGIDR